MPNMPAVDEEPITFHIAPDRPPVHCRADVPSNQVVAFIKRAKAAGDDAEQGLNVLVDMIRAAVLPEELERVEAALEGTGGETLGMRRVTRIGQWLFEMYAGNEDTQDEEPSSRPGRKNGRRGSKAG